MGQFIDSLGILASSSGAGMSLREGTITFDFSTSEA